MASTSRKPKTLSGRIMPEMKRPEPKMKPQTRLASARMIDQTPMPWRVTATTAMAAAMKIKVATIERGDSRAMPQTPCPDVQPLLNLRAEADQQTGDGDDDEARRHVWDRDREAERGRGERRRDQADDERRAPRPVAALRFDQSGEDSGDAGDAAVEEHQQRGGEPDQRAAERGGDRCEIGHGRYLVK